MNTVSYSEFAQLARRRGWTAAFLAERFRGKIEQPREFFERILAGSSKCQNLSASLIPYRSVLEFYQRELRDPPSDWAEIVRLKRK